MTKTTGNFKDFLTFTRASAATVRDAADGDRIKWPGHNLIPQSQNPSSWSKVKVATAEVPELLDPNGNPAWSITENAEGGEHYTQVTVSNLTGKWRAQVLAKAFDTGANRRLVIGERASTGVSNSFDLVTGQAVAGSGTIEDLGNGWYLCTLQDITLSGQTFGYRLQLDDDASLASLTYTGDGVSGAYVSGFRLIRAELPLVANPAFPSDPTYYPTTGTARTLNDLPRGNQPTGIPGKRGLLVEPARTNLLPYSEELTNAGWTNTNVSVSQSATIFGLKAFTLTMLAGANLFMEAVTATSSAMTLSCYIQKGTLDDVSLNRFGFYNNTAGSGVAFGHPNFTAGTFDVNSGSFDAIKFENISDDLWRLELTITSISGNEYLCYFGAVGGDAGTNQTITIAGCQVEDGQYATSYIPTAGAAATRAAEAIADLSLPDDFGFNARSGTFFAELYPSTDDANAYTLFDFANASVNASSRGRVYRFQNAWTFQVTASNVEQGAVSLGSSNKGALARIAATYQKNRFSGALNGVLATADTSGEAPEDNINQLAIGRTYNEVQNFAGVITALKFYPRALSDAQLQELTA